jgi:hypothetical protein
VVEERCLFVWQQLREESYNIWLPQTSVDDCC